MSRLRRYVHSLTSGYLMLAVNILYTLGSVPLALSYLSKPEFGLWAMVSQLAFYLNLLDFGMAGAGTRILIDHKDDREGTNYGSVIQTGLLVNLAHGCLVFIVGLGAACVLGPLLNVPPELDRSFRWLVFWQCVSMGVGCLARMAGTVLMAHQRYDLVNHSQTLFFAVNFGVLWLCFRLGMGVLSLAWAQGVGQVLGALLTVLFCLRLRLLPGPGRWGRPAWRWFRELFFYGRDMFLYSTGNLLINFSQTILITRVSGLDLAAVWSICTRAFSLLSQFTYRIFDFSIPALGEMIVRGEKDQLFKRFRSMVTFSSSAALVAGSVFAVSNQGFTRWWTRGEIGWSARNDCLLAVWLLVLVLVRSHTGLVGLTKDFRFLRYIYFCEGLFFVTVGFVGLRLGGVFGMLAVSILGSLLITLPYSIWRTGRYFSISWKEVALDWMRPTMRMVPVLVPLAAVVGWFTRSLAPLPRLIFCAGAVGIIGTVLLLRWGLDEAMGREIGNRLPPAFSRLRRWLGPPAYQAQPARAETAAVGRGQGDRGVG
jgi:O-antigen/teichoic acid export membrane protein